MVKQIFTSAMMFFGCFLTSVSSLKYISMTDQECKVIPEIVNVNSSEPVFYPFSIKTSKWSGTWNFINFDCSSTILWNASFFSCS